MRRQDEIRKYDVPAMINYILSTTGRQKLSYIGHSMGCATFFIAMITNPELNERIDVMMAMAPAIAMTNSRSPVFNLVAPFFTKIEVKIQIHF